MAKDKGSYETFDSGSGPTVKGCEGDMAHMDSKEGLQSYTSNKADDTQGAVPEVPKR